MALATRALHPLFGVEILGVDVKRVDDGTFKEIADAFNQHSVLLFRGQTLADEEQIPFGQSFGPLETTIRCIASQGNDGTPGLQPLQRRTRRPVDSGRRQAQPLQRRQPDVAHR